MKNKYGLTAQLVPALVLLLIWLPLLSLYYVPSPGISNDALARSRRLPANAVLGELSSFKFAPVAPMSGPELLAAADQIGHGYLQMPGYKAIQIGLPFDPRDLEQGLPTWQLAYAGMIAPDILMDAYRLSGKEGYFLLARDMVVAWARFEKAQWLPHGFLWNEHAVASRITVLAKFWGIYRSRGDYRPEVARAVLGMAWRGGEMLAKGSLFIFATNHGVMQNLALLHLAAAFPAIPNAGRYRQIALDRLTDQMKFYVNSEGIVLEHSAGYHSHGMELLGKAFRYLALNDLPPPHDWIAKYNKSKDFMSMIHRPDGSLPVFGNTIGAPLPPSLVTEVDPHGRALALALQEAWHPKTSHGLYPAAGYSVWWDNLGSVPNGNAEVQTVVAWSNFPGHGHKLADEMSLLVWADSQSWLTNVGYWPYGTWGRAKADTWEGSNAPHLSDEAPDSQRNTEVLGYTVQGRLAFNHLRRTGPSGFSVERQVLHLDSDLWLVLDHSSDKLARKSATTWTFFPNLELADGPLPGQFHLSRSDRRSCMSAYVSGKNKLAVKMYKGSRLPFAGWVVMDTQPRPAPALLVEQASENPWSLMLLSLERHCKNRLTGPPELRGWQSSERWQASLPLSDGAVSIERVGSMLYINDQLYALDAAFPSAYSKAQTALERAELADSFQAAERKYKKHKDWFGYRLKATYLLAAIFLIQEVFFAFYGRRGRHLIALRVLSTGAWIAGGAWLTLVYFSTG